MTEVWKAVVGFEGLYEVSDLGRVRSLTRLILMNRRLPNGETIKVQRRLHGRVLSPGTVESGHKIVVLGRGNSRLIHKLVLDAFVGPCPDGHEGCHRDGNPGHNAKSNLRWATRSDNIRDMLDHGKSRSGLSSADVSRMRRHFQTETNAQIAKAFGVTPNCVSLIRNGHTWSHVQ